MKNFTKLFGIIALCAVIGFGLTACSEEDGEPSITITGTPKIGQTVTASSSGGELNGHFGWQISSDGTTWGVGNAQLNQGETSGDLSQNLIIGERFAPVGRYIRARALFIGSGEYVISNVLGPVTAAD